MGESRFIRARALPFGLATLALLTSLNVAPPARAALATRWSFPVSPYRLAGYNFGTNVGSTCGVARKHVGFDAVASVGQQVRAAANGTIRGTFFESHVGWAMLIEHSVPNEGTVITRYANITPRSGYGAGRVVSRGEVVGTVYNLGSNTHHHFSVRMGEYDRYAWRGYLPAKACGGDPAFPGRFVDPTKYVLVHSDITPPTTTVSLTKSIASHRSGWTRGTWGMHFTCTDDFSGCKVTVHRVNDLDARAGSDIALDAEGVWSVVYRSYDVRGNLEQRRGPVVLAIDRTKPTVDITTTDATFAASEDVVVSATASDPSGGSPAGASGMYRARFRFCPNDSTDPAACQTVIGARDGDTWTGRPASTLAAGVYHVWALADDRVGNGATDDAVFTVIG